MSTTDAARTDAHISVPDDDETPERASTPTQAARGGVQPPTTVLGALRAHLLATVLCVALGIAAGLTVANRQSTVYTGEMRLAVAGSDLSAQAVPGYALASSELAANYARYVDTSEDQTELEKRIGAPEGSVLSITASPVPESNVVRIEAESEEPAVARDAVADLGDDLAARVAAAGSDKESQDVLARYAQLSDQVAAAEQGANATQGLVDSLVGRNAAQPALDAARNDAAIAASSLATLEVQQDALGQRYSSLVDTISSVGLRPVAPASIASDDEVSRYQRYGIAGLAAGALLAAVVASALEGRRRRRASGVAAR